MRQGNSRIYRIKKVAYMIKYAKLKKLNKTIASTALATGVLAGAFTGYAFLPHHTPAIYASSAYTWEDVSSSMCSNYNFASSGSDDIWSPTNFTAIDPTNIGSNSDQLKAGVIDCTATDIDDYNKTYGLSEQDINHTIISSASEDNGITHHLMINGMNNDTKYGFKTPDFTLEANSYYEISVLAKVTSNNGGFGTIVLDGLSNTHQANSIRITNTSWDTYSFYVSTGANIAETVNLQLWLGSENETSTDAIFYNKINMKRYSHSAFETEPNKDVAGKTLTIDLEIFDTVHLFDNQDFSTSLTNGWTPMVLENNNTATTLCDVYSVKDNYPAELEDLGITKPYSIGNTGNGTALLMYNKETASQGIASTPFTIERDSVYRLSVWAKSDCGATNGATINLVELNNTEGTPTTATQSVATTITENASFNDWTQYNFYIKGNPFHNSIMQLQLLLGTSETPTSGYVWFDEITMQKVTNSEYIAPLGTNVQVNLDKSATATILNGEFTSVENETTNNTGALTPANWTLSTSDDNYDLDKSISGVVATRADLFATTLRELSTKEYYTPLTNPGLTPDETTTTINNTKNKVLLLGNGNKKTTQTYISDDFTLEGNARYRISFLVQTQGVTPSATSGVTLKVKTDEKTIYQQSGITSDGTWDTYALYLSTDTDAKSYTIELTLDNSTGYAFFDKVLLQSFSDEDSYQLDYTNSAINHKHEVVSTKNTFDNYVQNDYVTDGHYEPFDWTLSIENNPQQSDIKAGVTKYNLENVLALSSDRDAFVTYKYNKSYTFSADNYYKLAITLKTDNMGQLAGLEEVNDEGDVYPFGAYITLSNIGSFKGIVTRDETGNGYKTYTFYIAPNNSTTSELSISLGSEHALTYGDIYIQNITLETIENASSFDSQTSDLDSKYNLVVNNIETNDEEDNTPTNNGNGGSDLRLDIVIPSVLLALAILIAIIGTLLRRVKIHKKPKVKTSYDRRKTIEVQLNKQERIDLRQSIIEDLNAEIADINQEIENIKQEYKTLIDDAKQQHTALLDGFKQELDDLKQEHQAVVKEYKSKIKSLTSDEEKAKAEKQFAKRVRHLHDREDALNKKLEIKDDRCTQLEQKRDAQIKKQEEQKQLIVQEIEQVKQEIEAISHEDDEMWSEYQKAKEEEKQEKLITKTEKRKAKQTKNTTLDTDEKVQDTEVSNQATSEEKQDTPTTDDTSTHSNE